MRRDRIGFVVLPTAVFVVCSMFASLATAANRHQVAKSFLREGLKPGSVAHRQPMRSAAESHVLGRNCGTKIVVDAAPSDPATIIDGLQRMLGSERIGTAHLKADFGKVQITGGKDIFGFKVTQKTYRGTKQDAIASFARSGFLGRWNLQRWGELGNDLVLKELNGNRDLVGFGPVMELEPGVWSVVFIQGKVNQ